jgi:phage protein D
MSETSATAAKTSNSDVASNVAAENGWRAAYDELKGLDEDMVKSYNSDIDQVLTFVRVKLITSILNKAEQALN